MKLGEAVEKRDYYLRCLIETTNIIKQSSVATDKYSESDNTKRIDKLMKLLSSNYEEYQKFNLLVSRAESTTMLPLEDGSKVSIRDAMAVKEAIKVKYDCYDAILSKVTSTNGSACVDIDVLSEGLLNYHDEIYGIVVKINAAMWEIEV